MQNKHTYTFTFDESENLHATFTDDLTKYNPDFRLPDKIAHALPKLIPSYTLMKVVEVFCISASSGYMQKDAFSLGINFSINNKHPLSPKIPIKFEITTQIRKNKLLIFNFEIFDSDKLAAWGSHTRLIKSID